MQQVWLTGSLHPQLLQEAKVTVTVVLVLSEFCTVTASGSFSGRALLLGTGKGPADRLPPDDHSHCACRDAGPLAVQSGCGQGTARAAVVQAGTEKVL